jgi:archaellum component FlaC
MSALFDKELQRQQRTNYESRSQVEERPDRSGAQDSALDRIRDLARRQEELNRRQRELAGANLSAEEMKRRLERLTREQAELREQAEALAKQQAQQGGQWQGASAMRDVSEQMRDAMNDLRREDAQSAAQKGERAAGQLRSLEQQARGRDADGQQQATGELQLEAQQLAEAQRRIAAEVERLEREGTGNAGARRRLADEKDRLAGRADELRRAAQQAGQAEAARELERGQVGQRMRETAKQLREGSQKTSAEERQLARTLDQVSERLGAAAGGAEAQRLSDELKQTQAIRDRLNRLEQQIREAEGRKDGGTEGRKDGRAEGRKDGGTEGRKGGGTDAPNAGGQELEKLRAEYQRELARAREALGRLQRQGGGEGSTPEQHEYSRSAPGTEQFKQDRSKWESLRKDVDVALERYEAAASDRLKKKNDASDRLNAGASDRVPDKYRDLVATYFQSLATGRRK